MRRELLAMAAAILLAAPAYADREPAHETGPGTGILQPGTEGSCGTLLLNADETYENGFAWSYLGIVSPYYGAFAECYTGPAEVCSAVFDFSQTGNQDGRVMDVYIWGDDGGIPGSVLAMTASVDPGPIAFWPSISRHTAPIDTDCIDGTFYVGYWGDWNLTLPGWFIAADVEGTGIGCPLTNIAPDIGYPTGWSDVSIVWGPINALGIGCEVNGCVVPTEAKSWGQIKRLF